MYLTRKYFRAYNKNRRNQLGNTEIYVFCKNLMLEKCSFQIFTFEAKKSLTL